LNVSSVCCFANKLLIWTVSFQEVYCNKIEGYEVDNCFFPNNFIISVSYSQIYVNSIAVGANDGTSWNDAFTDIQSGINAADASPIETEVWLLKALISRGHKLICMIMFRFTGDFQMLVTLFGGDRNYLVNTTIISGNNMHRVIYNNGGGITNTAILDGFTIQEGTSATGAGIYFQNVSPVVRNCIITNNNSTNDAGGVYLRGGTVSFINCTISNNTAVDEAGGVYLRDGAHSFNNCTIDGNTANDDAGRGVYFK
jgi:hypothetical protein